MVKGAEHHEEAERIERETAILVPLTVEKLQDKKQDLSFVREDVRAVYQIEFDTEKGKALLTLKGRADKVIRMQSTLIIYDDKSTVNPSRHDNRTEPYLDSLLQLLTYLHSKFYLGRKLGGWAEIPHSKKMYQVNIIDRNSGQIYKTYEETVTKVHTQLLIDHATKFALKCLELDALAHHNNKYKCRPCGYFKDCSFALR